MVKFRAITKHKRAFLGRFLTTTTNLIFGVKQIYNQRKVNSKIVTQSSNAQNVLNRRIDKYIHIFILGSWV